MLKLINGDYAVDLQGKLIHADDNEKIVQQAMILLTMPKGSFGYSSQLGSELYRVDLNSCDDNTLLAIVCEALEPINTLEVNSVKRSLASENDTLSITIDARTNGDSTALILRL